MKYLQKKKKQNKKTVRIHTPDKYIHLKGSKDIHYTYNKIKNGRLKKIYIYANILILLHICYFQISSVTQSFSTLCDPMNHSTPGLPVHHKLLEFTQTHVHRVGDAIQPFILCCPLLLLPPTRPSIRVFSNESTLSMSWPKYWSFSLSMSPSNEHPGLVSFKMNWLDLLAV